MLKNWNIKFRTKLTKTDYATVEISALSARNALRSVCAEMHCSIQILRDLFWVTVNEVKHETSI